MVTEIDADITDENDDAIKGCSSRSKMDIMIQIFFVTSQLTMIVIHIEVTFAFQWITSNPP